MILRRLIPVLLATVLFAPHVAWAWADGGHKAVALIAWEKLGEQERAWVQAVLEKHPLWEEHFQKPLEAALGTTADQVSRQKWLFAQAAVWPDIIRGPRGAEVNPWEKWHRPLWHYIDYPVFASDAARAAMESKVRIGPMDWQPGRADFLESKLNAVQCIKRALHDLADTSLPAPDRAVMLCWLFHLIGDIHQPCHAATLFDPVKLPAGDRGGNGTTIEGLPSKPLHAYWDDLLGRPGTSFAKAGETAKEMLKIPVVALPGKPDDWAHQSNASAKSDVYPPSVLTALDAAPVSSYRKNGQTFSSVTIRMTDGDLAAYQKKALEVARRRGLMAGIRLAESLRSVVQPASPR